jgi:hypothetical protein
MQNFSHIGKRPLGRPRQTWEDIVKMDLTEIRPEGANWIHLIQVRCKWQTLVNMIMNVWVP